MPDPTDEAVAAMRKALGYPNSRRSRSLVKDALDAIPTDVLARVVAGRPDQPTQTTPLFEGTVASVVPTVVGDFHIDIATTDDSNLPALGDRVTVYATDPHTPNQGDTP